MTRPKKAADITQKTRTQETRTQESGIEETATEETTTAETERQMLETGRRFIHTKLSFWRVCPLKVCKRARGCRGDVDACWRLWRPAIPEEFMVKMHAAFSARAAGLSIEESLCAADQKAAEYKSLMVRSEENHARRDATAPPSAPPRNLPAPVPRVRLT